MKNNNQIELNQYKNQCIVDAFVNLFISKDIQSFSNLLNPSGTFCNLSKEKFIAYLEELFNILDYKINSYNKNYSTILKTAEVVHSFVFKGFDCQNIEIESIQMNLLIHLKNNQIHAIYTENNWISEQEFELRQFYN
jgi:hypothetical protein